MRGQSDQEDSFPSGTIWEDFAAEVLHLSEESVFPMFFSQGACVSLADRRMTWLSQGSKRSTQALLKLPVGNFLSIITPVSTGLVRATSGEKIKNKRHPSTRARLWASLNCIYSLNISQEISQSTWETKPFFYWNIYWVQHEEKNDTFW